jgi:hypothetical protein
MIFLFWGRGEYRRMPAEKNIGYTKLHTNSISEVSEIQTVSIFRYKYLRTGLLADTYITARIGEYFAISKLAKEETLLTCIWKMTSSNPGRDIDYPI